MAAKSAPKKAEAGTNLARSGGFTNSKGTTMLPAELKLRSATALRLVEDDSPYRKPLQSAIAAGGARTPGRAANHFRKLIPPSSSTAHLIRSTDPRLVEDNSPYRRPLQSAIAAGSANLPADEDRMWGSLTFGSLQLLPEPGGPCRHPLQPGHGEYPQLPRPARP